MTEEYKLLRNASLAGGTLLAAAILVFVFNPSPALLTAVSSFFPLVLSLIGTGLAFGNYHRQTPNRGGAVVWAAMGAGLLCWAAGELIWFLNELPGSPEVSGITAADLFWLIGYFPLSFALAAPYLSLRASIPVRGRRILLAVLGAMMILLIGVVIVPILSSPEAGTPMEMAVALAYPGLDFLLLSVALALAMVFLGGQVGLSWGIIAAGILLFAVSDLFFSYGSWHGLYYPDGQLNFLSGAFDILYLAAYIVLNIGLFLRLRLPEPGRDIDLRAFIPLQGMDYLLMADQKGRVVFIDPALHPLLGLREAGEGIGKTFGQLFALPRAYEDAAIRKAAKTGISDDFTVALGLSRTKYRLRVVTSSAPDQFPGFDILLHPDRPHPVPIPDRESILLGHIANRVQDRTRRFSPGDDPLRVYFNTLFELIFILVSRVGGAGVGEAFEAVVNEKARALGCHFVVTHGRGVWDETSTDPGRYRDLLEEGVRYADRVMSAATIGRKMEEIERFMDPAVVREAEEHRLRRVRWLKDETG
ncbi:MAG: hypothetical protein JW748_05175 [Anaerolineales bacterium]|nr:hypothetical protein [Anaerolineales bacterium]